MTTDWPCSAVRIELGPSWFPFKSVIAEFVLFIKPGKEKLYSSIFTNAPALETILKDSPFLIRSV